MSMNPQERELVMSQLADIGAHLDDFPSPDPVVRELLNTIRKLTVISMMLLEETMGRKA